MFWTPLAWTLSEICVGLVPMLAVEPLTRVAENWNDAPVMPAATDAVSVVAAVAWKVLETLTFVEPLIVSCGSLTVATADTGTVIA